MNVEEREAVLKTLWFGCPADLPGNMHIELDLLRRLTGRSMARLKRVLGDLRSLGFTCRVRAASGDDGHQHGQLGRSEMLELAWADLSDDSDYPALLVAREMVVAGTDGYCEEHGWQFLERLDFSQLATVTATVESHSEGQRSKARRPRAKRARGRRR